MLIIACVIQVNAQNWEDVGTGLNDPAYCMAEYNGELYVGGHFTTAGGVVANGIAKWNGTGWSALGSGVVSNSSAATVYALIVYNGELYVGGIFNTAGGITVNGLAKWSGNAWHGVTGYLPILTYSCDPVNGLFIYNNELLVANTTGRIRKWNGLSWTNFGGKYHLSEVDNAAKNINAFCIYNNELYASGSFNDTTATNNDFDGVGKWNGSNWEDITGLWTYAAPQVNYLVVYNGEMYASGLFTSIGGILVKHIAKWDGTSWSTVNLTPMYRASVYVYNNILFVNSIDYPYSDVKYLSGTNWTSVSQNGYSCAGGFLYSPNPMIMYNSKIYTNGCKFQPSTISNFIYITPGSIGVEEEAFANSIEVFPSPSQGDFTIQASSIIDEVIIHDVLGQEVYTSMPKSETADIQLDKKGVYFIKITSKGESSLRKVVVE